MVEKAMMKVEIGGLQKVSLVDYPGRISAVVFMNGCNFTCPYCHNPGLARGEHRPGLPSDDVLHYLAARRGLIEGVVVSGGEPTLQPDLADFCRAVQSLGYAVKLDTNGSRPDVLRNLIRQRLIDDCSMDLKTDPEHYPALAGAQGRPEAIRESIRLLMASQVSCEFRTTCVRPYISPASVRRIAALIEGAKVYTIQKFCAKQTLDPKFGSFGKRSFDDDELLELKAIAEPLVESCTLRG
jgi:pyruvate formate lyase activating enzyme